MELSPGELMRTYRTRKDLTQEALAELIGSYQVRVSRIENGVEMPTQEEIRLIESSLKQKIWSNETRGVINGE